MAVVKTLFDDAVLKKEKKASGCSYVAGDSDIDLVFSMKIGSEPEALADKLAE